MKKNLFLSLLLILLVACSSETSEYDKCLQSYKAIQEANLTFNELITIYPSDVFTGEEFTKIQVNEFKVSITEFWYLYIVANAPDDFGGDNLYELTGRKGKESFMPGIEDRGVRDLYDYIENNIDTEEKLINLMEYPVLEINKINENLKLIEPDVNNITNFYAYQEMLEDTSEIIKSYIADLPELTDNYEIFSDIFIEWDEKNLSFNAELIENIYASNVIVELYEKCEDN